MFEAGDIVKNMSIVKFVHLFSGCTYVYFVVAFKILTFTLTYVGSLSMPQLSRVHCSVTHQPLSSSLLLLQRVVAGTLG